MSDITTVDSSTGSTTGSSTGSSTIRRCGDCISREELKQKFQWLERATKYGNEDSEQQDFSYSTMMMYEIADMIEDAIDNCSSVEPERKVGHWKPMSYDGYADGNPVYDEWECDQCGCEHYGEEDTLTTYCPDCGAKMEVWDDK